MFSPFISRLLLLRQFSILENEIKILGKNFYLQPIEQLVIFQRNIEKKFGKKGLDLIYESGRESFFKMSKDMEKFSESRNRFHEAMINMIKHFGFGNLEIVEIKQEELRAKIIVRDNPFAKEYVKSFGYQKNCLDHMLSGIIAGYFSNLFRKEVKCKEDSCIGKENLMCEFTVSKLK